VILDRSRSADVVVRFSQERERDHDGQEHRHVADASTHSQMVPDEVEHLEDAPVIPRGSATWYRRRRHPTSVTTRRSSSVLTAMCVSELSIPRSEYPARARRSAGDPRVRWALPYAMPARSAVNALSRGWERPLVDPSETPRLLAGTHSTAGGQSRFRGYLGDIPASVMES
jgi:hypothetical protein